jgi:predicted flap endonuclease-1-like 5' DNA nuclease
MGRFIRGFVIGITLGQFLAPMRGQEMRHLLSERIQGLLGYLPNNMLSKQSTQQVIDHPSQRASDVENTSQQITSQARDTAGQLSNAVKQTTLKMPQTGTDTANTVQQSASSTRQNVQENIPAAKDTAASEERNMQNDSLERINNISPEVRKKLEAAGIQTTPQLLENAQTQAERAELAKKVGVSHRVLRGFTFRADLMRLTNLGEDIANILEEAGVNGCRDLQHRNPEHLHFKLLKMQESGSNAVPIPDIGQITTWIVEAKGITQSLQK